MSRSFDTLMATRPVILAPLEGYSDAVFRRLCRSLGAELCVTEFVNVENLLHDCRRAKRKMTLAPDDRPTAIQIYGANPDTLEEAARIAEAASPSYIDLNCGCWVPKIAGRGAGAGWLRDPEKMVEMAARIVRAVSLPVTVKTRIGWGPESDMPIVDLARRLEDVGVRALTIHCRTAKMGHTGAADWTWAQRAREVVSIPVIVNGDVTSAEAAERALNETGCEGVMIGRRAIQHPWIFAEARALLDRGVVLPPPDRKERIRVAREHLIATVAEWGERFGVPVMRRSYAGYFAGLPDLAELRAALNACPTLEGTLAILDDADHSPYAPSFAQTPSFA
ncbi:MAG: tRNA dihydrouridine synthase DusB [Deltaproteobacteria bacterium]|nr:tRNA dihydrouridine synthase DusB [Deltaproteobacteria bacterium]